MKNNLERICAFLSVITVLTILCITGFNSADKAYAKDSDPWRIVSTESAQVVPAGNGQYMTILKKPYPLKVTIEINGLYPGLPDINIADDFIFYKKDKGMPVDPLQVTSPVLPENFIGNAKQTVRYEIYLANYSTNSMFGAIVNRGYTSNELVFSFKNGPKRPLPKQLK